MGLSSETLIHSTKSLSALLSIFKEGFRPKYCVEKLSLNESNKEFRAAYPMVCFCDLPLSEIKSHVIKYGNYGIGLDKKWGRKNLLNPVLYFDNSSELLNDLFQKFQELAKANEEIGEYFLKIFSYSKNYEGANVKLDVSKYRYSDEREWRFVPSKTQLNGCPPYIPSKKFEEKRDQYIKSLSEKRITLKFDLEDVKYIITEKDSEISDILNSLDSIYAGVQDDTPLKLLKTRIITTEQIKSDF